MPAKRIKLSGSGRVVEIVSILLPNGNLLIPARAEQDRNQVVWKEVKPGTSEHKRWHSVAEKRPDPREREDYQQRLQALATIKNKKI